MPDSAGRAARFARRILLAVALCELIPIAVVVVSGGFTLSAGPLPIRVHDPWRLLGSAAILGGLALWLGGAGAVRDDLERAWQVCDRRAGWVVVAAAAGAMATGLLKGTWVAGSADAYGYVSQALLWLKGMPIQAQPLAAQVPWPNADWSLSPLGYRPGLDGGTIVPTYPPGLPLAMAGFAGVGGPSAVYWVVPVLGAAAVWLTYLLGRRHAGGASGAVAALLLATSPVFLYQLVQPMSDVPVTAWWLLSLWSATAGRPLVAGAAAAAAVLTRPNLTPLAMLVLAAVAVGVNRQHRNLRATLSGAVAFALPLAVSVAFLAWLNVRFYGSASSSGYGAASELFAMANVPTNISRYTTWLVDTQTPVVLLGLGAPFVEWFASRRAADRSSSTRACFGFAFIALVLASYLPYSPFEEWWYLRFLLPALPVLLILTSSVLVRLLSAAPSALRLALLLAGIALLGAHYVVLAGERSAFELQRLESRYATAGRFAARSLPPNAVLLSLQESGPLRFYGGRATIRFDYLDPRGLDAAVAFLDHTGYRPYFVLEAWEEPQFRDRFAPSSALGLLDWPPVAEVGSPVNVKFYDPRDRARFLAGEPVATDREPLDSRRMR